MLLSNQILLQSLGKIYLHKFWIKILATEFQVRNVGLFVSLCLLLHSTPSHTEGGVLLIYIFHFVVILSAVGV